MKQMITVDFAEESYGFPTDICLSNDYQTILVSTSKGYVLTFAVDCLNKSSRLKMVNNDELIIHKLLPLKSNFYIVFAEDGRIFLCDPDKSFIASVGIEEDVDLGSIHSAAYHAEVDQLYLGNESGDLFCCNLNLKKANLTVLQKFDHHDDFISSIVICHTKKTILVGSGDGRMSVVDMKKKKLIATTKNFDEDVTAVRLVEELGKIVLGTSGGALKVFDWNYWGAPCDSLKPNAHNRAGINAICVLTGGRIITATDDGILRLISLVPKLDYPIKIGEFEDDIQSVIALPNTERVALIPACESVLHIIPISSSSSQEETNSDEARSSEEQEECNPRKKKKKNIKSGEIINSRSDATAFFKDLD